MRRWVVIAATAVALAGCGGGTSKPHPAAKAPTTSTTCRSAAATRARARLRGDVAAIRRAAALKTRDTTKGNPAVNAATDRFLLDVARAPIDLLEKNRFIDRAAAALVGSCAQCFQALEAERPIPSIAHSGRCGSA
jgi:hypothetical protein